MIDLMGYWVGEGILTSYEFEALKAKFESCVHVIHSPGIPPELEVVKQSSGISVWYGNDFGVSFNASDFYLYNFPNWNR